jgi:hypothetical protein
MVELIHRLRPARQVEVVPVLLRLAADDKKMIRPWTVVKELALLTPSDVPVEVDQTVRVVGQFFTLNV